MGLPITGQQSEPTVQGRSENGDRGFVRSTSLASEMNDIVDDHVFECWHAFPPFTSGFDMGTAPAAAAIDRDSLPSTWPASSGSFGRGRLPDGGKTLAVSPVGVAAGEPRIARDPDADRLGHEGSVTGTGELWPAVGVRDEAIDLQPTSADLTN